MPLITPIARPHVAAHLHEGKEVLLHSSTPGIAYVVKVSADRQQWRGRRLRYGIAEGDRTEPFGPGDWTTQVEDALERWHHAFFGAAP